MIEFFQPNESCEVCILRVFASCIMHHSAAVVRVKPCEYSVSIVVEGFQAQRDLTPPEPLLCNHRPTPADNLRRHIAAWLISSNVRPTTMLYRLYFPRVVRDEQCSA